jgi:Tfp pilus assembly protein PilV
VGKLGSSDSGFAFLEALIALVAFVAVLLIGFYVFHIDHHTASANTTGSSKATTTKKSTTNLYAILSPATVPPKVPECSQSLTYTGNGNSGPIQCADGALNILAWNALSALEPSVMSLGYSASFSQVQAAVCSDASDSDSDANTSNANVIEVTTYQISALYYGWSFSQNPTAALSNGGC